ncbi:MAG: hypothetical protein ACXVAB_14600 [Thermodesulfobacteriota bacterium]
MLVYKVFYKDFEHKKGDLIGILIERRKNPRGMTLAESGLRWAKLTFGKLEKNGKPIFVIPNEMDLGNDAKWLTEKWMFTKQELLGLAHFVEQGIGK